MENEFEKIVRAEDNNPLALSWRKRAEELEIEVEKQQRRANFYQPLWEQSNIWYISRETMPEFDGEYYVCGYMHHECGNVTKIHKIATCRLNQWVKQNGEQYTYWRPLLPFPEFPSIEDF